MRLLPGRPTVVPIFDKYEPFPKSGKGSGRRNQKTKGSGRRNRKTEEIMRKFMILNLAFGVALGFGLAAASLPLGKVAQANPAMSAWGAHFPTGYSVPEVWGDGLPPMTAWGHRLYPVHEPGPTRGPAPGSDRRYGHGPMTAWGHFMGYQGGSFHIVTVDQDHDGIVSPDEAASVRERLFLDMDSNRNEDLSEDEYLRMYMGPGHFFGTGGSRYDDMARLLATGYTPMDKDGDGIVGKIEFMTAGETLYGASDSDGDGLVTIWEYQGYEH